MAFQTKKHIIYMQEHGLTRARLAGLPCRLPGIAPTCIRRMHQNGIIDQVSKDGVNVTTWGPGCNYIMFMEAWK